MNGTVLRCKRESAENETKSGAHTWQRDCAHARLVTRDGEIEITVSVTRSHVRNYTYRTNKKEMIVATYLSQYIGFTTYRQIV